jgi:hypothetical protein
MDYYRLERDGKLIFEFWDWNPRKSLRLSDLRMRGGRNAVTHWYSVTYNNSPKKIFVKKINICDIWKNPCYFELI